MFKRSKIDRIFELQREKRELLEADSKASEKDVAEGKANDYPPQEISSGDSLDADNSEALEQWKKWKAEERKENIKNFFSMLIAAILVFLPALLVLIAVFLFFIWLFFRVF